MIIRTRNKLVPFVFYTMGAFLLVLSGCKKEAEKKAETPSYLPASYVKDPVFRQELAEKRKALLSIAAERRPLADRLQALVKEHRENLAELQKIPEWHELHAKIVALNKKYEALKREQLQIVRARLSPTSDQKKISK